jgi:hypothetical protein
MPRAGWVLAEDIDLALEYFAGNHNLKLDRRVSADYADYTEQDKGTEMEETYPFYVQ